MVSTDLFIGGGVPDYGTQQYLSLKYANRHGLVAGATGTGKTVTLQIMAEGFANAGVPVFLSDVKGDLSGLAMAGDPNHKLNAPFTERAKKIGFADFKYEAFPVTFWDLFGEQGHPVRATVSDMGPLLLGRMLNLNEIQAGVLNLVFKIADDNGMLLLDLKDLRAMLQYVGDNGKQFRWMVKYGMTPAQAIQSATANAAEALGRKDIGVIEAGRYADIVAVKGNPAQDVSLLEQVDFVMKGGEVVKNP